MNRRSAAGFTSTWVLVLALFIIVFGLAAFDVWRVFSEQRILAAQADRAAVGAAQAIDLDAFADATDPRLVLLTGTDDASAEGRARVLLDESGIGGACSEGGPMDGAACVDEITVANPAPGATSAPTVTVTLRRHVELGFFPGGRTVAATATAAPRVAA